MEIRRYIALARSWAWLIVIAVILSGGVAFIVARNTPPTYLATTRILVDEAPGGATGNEYSQLLLEQKLAGTYVELIKTRPVMQKTIDALNLPFSPDELAANVTVSAAQDSKILRIGVEDGQSARAAAIANTLAEVFIQDNEDRQSQRYADSIAKRQELLDDISDQILQYELTINRMGEPETPEDEASLASMQTQLRETQIRYTQSFADLEDLRVEQARGANNLVVVESAVVPAMPIRPRVRTSTLLAMAVGGLVAIGIVFLIEYLDDTVKSPDVVEEDTGLSTLGVIAFIQDRDDGMRLITAREPRAPVSEAFRILRTNLGFSSVDEGLHSVVVSSASPGEGKSTVTANLAVVMAQAGRNVVVVDADLRLPVQHRIFNVPNNHGLTTAILDTQAPVAQHLQETSLPGLRILTSGPTPPNPAELLNSLRMQQVLEELQGEADMLIFDTPPILTVTDASIMASRVDGCIVVAQVGRTRRDTLVRAAENLKKTDATIFGVVLNRVEQRRAGYDYYYYTSQYSYNYDGRGTARQRTTRLPGWIAGLTNR